MENLRELQHKEGLERMKQLQQHFELNPNLVSYLEDDRVYYSYLTGGGVMIGSIDTITYDPKYVQYVQEFEKEYHAYVYHAIESKALMGNQMYKFLSLLYVSSHPEEWEYERFDESEDYVQACVIDLDSGFAEIGDIFLTTYKSTANVYNVLIRKA